MVTIEDLYMIIYNMWRCSTEHIQIKWQGKQEVELDNGVVKKLLKTDFNDRFKTM
jgi:hypothetical protein